MYIILKEAHNVVGMITLFLLLFVLIGVFVIFIQKKSFGRFSKTLSLMGLVVVHLQILFGIILYFLSPLGINGASGESMKHAISRFYLVEHPVGMILAAVLITIGYRRAKNIRFSETKKHGQILIFYGIGFGLIAYLIPWFLWS